MRRCLLLFFVPALFAWGEVNGTVVNLTTGQPQPGATVTMYKLGDAGMEPLQSVRSDAEGKFEIAQNPQGPSLLQTAYDGVTYHLMLPPGSSTTGLRLEVYDSSSKPGSAKVSQHFVILEPADGQLMVSENVIFQNNGKLSYNDPDKGTLRLFLPDAAKGQVRVMATPPNGMPIQRSAEKTGKPNVYKVDFPIKPGETRFDIAYTLPFSPPAVFSGKSLQDGAPLRLVAPMGVTLTGAGLESLGQEPHTQASVYGVKGQEYKVEIQGTGTLRAAQEAMEEDAGPSIEQILPRIYTKVYWIVGLGLGVLALGFVLLYRRSSLMPPSSNSHPTTPRDKHR